MCLQIFNILFVLSFTSFCVCLIFFFRICSFYAWMTNVHLERLYVDFCRIRICSSAMWWQKIYYYFGTVTANQSACACHKSFVKCPFEWQTPSIHHCILFNFASHFAGHFIYTLILIVLLSSFSREFVVGKTYQNGFWT